uniref:Uncharacterized protein n=1 Tax=Glossina morsitans morsitans TaxID=37546 RepID=A0A1B0G1P7_GLOMM
MPSSSSASSVGCLIIEPQLFASAASFKKELTNSATYISTSNFNNYNNINHQVNPTTTTAIRFNPALITKIRRVQPSPKSSAINLTAKIRKTFDPEATAILQANRDLDANTLINNNETSDRCYDDIGKDGTYNVNETSVSSNQCKTGISKNYHWAEDDNDLFLSISTQGYSKNLVLRESNVALGLQKASGDRAELREGKNAVGVNEIIIENELEDVKNKMHQGEADKVNNPIYQVNGWASGDLPWHNYLGLQGKLKPTGTIILQDSAKQEKTHQTGDTNVQADQPPN